MNCIRINSQNSLHEIAGNMLHVLKGPNLRDPDVLLSHPVAAMKHLRWLTSNATVIKAKNQTL